MLLTLREPCLNPEFQQEQLKNYHARKICVSLRGLLTWKVMPRNVVERYCELGAQDDSTTLQGIYSMH